MNKAIRIFGMLTTFGMLIVIIMGVIVTNTGSELGCGHHWPLCYGQLVPNTSSQQTLIEFSHRAVSALLGFMIVILAIWSWIKFSHIKGTKLLAVASVFFVILQGVLGGAAVIWSQSSFILALHFGISLISFASVLLLTVIIYEQTKLGKTFIPTIGKGIQRNVISLIIYTYIVIYSGAFVRHTDSAMGCLGWPLCNGELIPDLYSRAGVQFIHRAMAGILVIWLVVTFLIAIFRYRNQGWVMWGSFIAAATVLCQAGTGALVVFTRMNLSILLLHSLFVTCLFGTLSFMTMIALRRPKKTST